MFLNQNGKSLEIKKTIMALSDRITEDADWKEGINAFRLDVRRQIEQLQREIKTLKKKINNKKP